MLFIKDRVIEKSLICFLVFFSFFKGIIGKIFGFWCFDYCVFVFGWGWNYVFFLGGWGVCGGCSGWVFVVVLIEFRVLLN